MNHDIQETLAYAQHLLAEHRRVHKLLTEIEDQWLRTDDSARSPDAITALRERVEKLRCELANHFAEEEAGGVLEEAAARLPDLGKEVNNLDKQHASLLADLDRIIVGLYTATGSGLIPGELKEAFEKFAGQLKAHEASENRVLAQGFRMEIS